jgi:hypothetical protein
MASAHGDTASTTVDSAKATANRNPIDVYILQDVEAMEFEASSSNGSLPSELGGVLLTDSQIPNVLWHQLDILEAEFPVGDSVASSSSSRNVEMLQRLVAIEERYSHMVVSCKKKDGHRAASVIGEFAYHAATTTAVKEEEEEEDDPVILSALGRTDSIKGLVDRILRVQTTES